MRSVIVALGGLLLGAAFWTPVTLAQPETPPAAKRPQFLPVAKTPEQKQLAKEIADLLENNCARCHGGSNGKNAGLDVTDPDSLIAPRGAADSGLAAVVPGDPAKSLLFDSIETGFMPQGGSPEAVSFPKTAVELIKKWIEAGAPWPSREATIRTFKDDLKSIRQHLEKTRADDRPHMRYFTLSHLESNERVSETNLRLYRAALSKTLNSLHWKPDLVIPQVLDKTDASIKTDESVYVVDLRKLGWDFRKWAAIMAFDPYGLNFDLAKDPELKDLAKTIKQLTTDDQNSIVQVPVYVRIDTFVAITTRPPLYHELLDLPETLEELESRLGVNRLKNIAQTSVDNRLIWRGGFAASGVSKQNRLVERHQLPSGGYYWLSYDFKPRNPRGDLVRFPLGPREAKRGEAAFAFEADGGEAIFSLPNKMQAYFLVDGIGKRLNDGPVDVVFDRAAVAGVPLVVNGVSCMNCHARGMIDFRDEIADSDALGSGVQGHIQALYPPNADTQVKVVADRTRFLDGVRDATRQFLCVAEHASKSVEEFKEPIGFVVERYSRDLGPREVAFELGLPSVDDLLGRIDASRELRSAGLGPLRNSPPGTIKRDKWESGAFGKSINSLPFGYDTFSSGLIDVPKSR